MAPKTGQPDFADTSQLYQHHIKLVISNRAAIKLVPNNQHLSRAPVLRQTMLHLSKLHSARRRVDSCPAI